MILRSLACILAAALLALLAPTKVARANLIMNPGFETGDFTGWTLSDNSMDFAVVKAFPHSGSFSARLDTETGSGFGRLSQTLATTPGQRYIIELWFTTDPVTNTPTNGIQVSWDGRVVFDQEPINGPEPYTNYGAKPGFQNNLLATGPTTRLEIGVRNFESFWFLDDVAVNPTPEPTTLLLLGTTMAGLGLARWRRRREN